MVKNRIKFEAILIIIIFISSSLTSTLQIIRDTGATSTWT